MTTTISYDQIAHGPTEVQTFDWEQTEAYAQELMQTTADAYVAEFTHNLAVVPEKDIRAHYDPDSTAAVQRFLDRTRDIHDRGARLAVMFGKTTEPTILGYTKIGPADALTAPVDGREGRYTNEAGEHEYEGYYLNNIVVNPGSPRHQQFWNRGLGSVILHAGLTLPIPETDGQELDRSKPVVLDGFDVSVRINNWYRSLGFERHEIPTDGMQFGETDMPQSYYATPGYVALGGVKDALEARMWQLSYYSLDAV